MRIVMGNGFREFVLVEFPRDGTALSLHMQWCSQYKGPKFCYYLALTMQEENEILETNK